MSPLRHIRALPVNLEKDWHELFSSFWSAWSTPRQAAMAATFPHIGEGGAKEATSFAMKKAQYLDFAKTGPGQQWIKLVDKEKAPSSIIGGLCLTHWKDAQKPKNVPKLAEVKQASQQPQMITQQLYGQLDVWHSQVMQSREHICQLFGLIAISASLAMTKPGLTNLLGMQMAMPSGSFQSIAV